MANKGLPVVMEGQRINLRVFRRFFYPIQMKHDGKQFIVYSDTKRESEINYNRAEDYDLDDPFNRIKLIRLARATKSLQVNPEDPQEYRVTVCTNRELYEPHSEETKYIPFDPKRLEPLEDRIKKERRKLDWDERMNPTD
ncbi:MAG: hypothetical protein NWF07_09105 [Candidatus Bathyarchaeota archaeon]|nr:hypothetical protein [Candidatus Bathyarchaeota archaeon]